MFSLRPRTAAIILGVSAAWTGPTPAGAQTQPFVPPTLGTTVFTSNGGYLEADSIDGTVIRTITARLVEYPLLGSCYLPNRNSRYDAKAVDEFWPLTPGKRIKFEIELGKSRWFMEFHAVGRQQVKVPAGTFDAWLIEVEESALGPTYNGLLRCWYVPEIGLPVKRQLEIKAGRGNGFNEEAVRIDKRDRSKVAEFRAPAPHTVFNTTTGFFRIDAARGTNLLQVSSNPNRNLWWIGGLRSIPLPDRYADDLGAEITKIWPLEAGKSVDFQGDFPAYSPGEISTYHYEASVERTEIVTVPAGTFSTFVIKWRERGLGSNTFDGIKTFWWSPALGFSVKQESHIVSGLTNWTNYELLNVQRPPN